MLGWIGVGILTFAYVMLLLTTFRIFAFINAIASTILTIHAYIIADVPFMLVNGFIALVMSYKFLETFKVEKNEFGQK